MLAAVTQDREKLRARLAAETDARKRLEAEKRELESKLRLGSTTSDVNSRKALGVQNKLVRQEEELRDQVGVVHGEALDLRARVKEVDRLREARQV